MDEDKRKDHISHFILRIAYSRTEDLRRWFLRQVSSVICNRPVQTVCSAIVRTPRLAGSLVLIILHQFTLHVQEEQLFKYRFSQTDPEGR
jgi:hypothetical protein